MSAVEKPLFSTKFPSLVRPTASPEDVIEPVDLPISSLLPCKDSRNKSPGRQFHMALGVCSWLVHLRTRTSNKGKVIQHRGSTTCSNQPSLLLQPSPSAGHSP